MLFVVASPLAAQTKTFEKTTAVNPGGILRFHAERGSVRLEGWDRNEVAVRARIDADSSMSAADARRLVDATEIEFIVSGANDVTVRANYDKVPHFSSIFGDYRRTPNIHYEIRAPRRMDLRLKIDRSDSDIRAFEGRIDLEADRSVIRTADLTGPVRARLDRGGDSSFRTLRGSFDIVGDRTNIHVGVDKLDASSRIQTDRGDINISLARTQGADLQTSLSRRASFDTSLNFQSRVSRRDNPSGPVNGGGPRLFIQADRGSVRLR